MPVAPPLGVMLTTLSGVHPVPITEQALAMMLAFARSLGLDRDVIQAVGVGAMLHDLGKIGVPDAVLLKPGRLTPDEWQVMQRHVEIGVEICRPLRSMRPVLPLIRHHHERWDGQGYPDGSPLSYSPPL